MQEQLDPTVVNLAKAIRQTESGGNFKAKGKSGEFGAYQYTPDTWNAVAPKYGITSRIEDATPEDQNKVTYHRLKEWKDKGHNVGQIASMWNAGEWEPDAYTGRFGATTKTHKAGDSSEGVNSYGVRYSVPKYAKSVAEAYQKIKRGGQVGPDPQNPSSVTAQSQQESASIPELNNPVSQLSTGVAKSIFGGALPNIGLTIADQTVGRLGNAIAGKGFVPTNTAEETKQNPITKELNKESKSGWETAGKVYGNVAQVAATGLAGGLGTTAVKESGALGSNIVKNIIKADLGPSEVLGSLKYADKADILANVLKSASAGEKPLIEQALKELSQKVLIENGVKAGLLKSTITYLKSHPVLSLLGFQQLEPAAKNMLKGLYQKYIGDQLASPNPNNTMTINPAP